MVFIHDVPNQTGDRFGLPALRDIHVHSGSPTKAHRRDAEAAKEHRGRRLRTRTQPWLSVCKREGGRWFLRRAREKPGSAKRALRAAETSASFRVCQRIQCPRFGCGLRPGCASMVHCVFKLMHAVPGLEEGQQRRKLFRLHVARIGRHVGGSAEDPSRDLLAGQSIARIRQVRAADSAIP